MVIRFWGDEEVVMWNNILNAFQDLEFYGDYSRIPKLSECRGKIVVFSFDSKISGYTWPSGDNGKFSNEKIYYDDSYTGIMIGEKQNRFKDCVDHILSDNPLRIHVCFSSLSASADLNNIGNPLSNSLLINPLYSKVLFSTGAYSHDRSLGIIPMDFPENGLGLISDIIKSSDGFARTGQCCFYKNENFQGDKFCLKEDTPFLIFLIWNNEISSWKCSAERKALVFKNFDYQVPILEGKNQCGGSYPTIGSDYDDSISSIRIVKCTM
jgi:hypothetical protein